MSNFTIITAQYDGTSGGSGDPDPLVSITGTVNGKNVYPRVFFGYLAAANATGQMQSALTAVMYNWYASVYGYQFTPWSVPIPFPVFPASDEIAQHVEGPFPQPNVSYQPALIGSWTA
jgi:hypothetical protein